MSKNMHIENTIPVEKSSYSSGTRGESAMARNKSGNHHGNRVRGNHARGAKATRMPKNM